VLTTDCLVRIDTASARGITLPACSGSTANQVIFLKDRVGSAATNNITITPAATEKIDNAATYVIAQANANLRLHCTGVAGAEWVVE
jgi:mannitol-specific phosphotransferase system IIBC component